MNANVGTIDRIVRIILGIGLVAMVFVGPQTPWGWLGLIFIVTGAISWCPIYKAAGLSTSSKS